MQRSLAGAGDWRRNTLKTEVTRNITDDYNLRNRNRYLNLTEHKNKSTHNKTSPTKRKKVGGKNLVKKSNPLQVLHGLKIWPTVEIKNIIANYITNAA